MASQLCEPSSTTNLLCLPRRLLAIVLADGGVAGVAAANSCKTLRSVFRDVMSYVPLASSFLISRHGTQSAARYVESFACQSRLLNDIPTLRHGAIIAELLSKVVASGAELDMHDAFLLTQAAKAGRDEVIGVLLDRLRYGPSAFALSRALTTAAQHGQAGVLTALLRAGAPVGAYQGAALLAASGHGDPEVVHRLCAAGADPTADGSAALRRAVQGGHVEAARVLLLHGADPRARCSAVLLHACELQVTSASASASSAAASTPSTSLRVQQGPASSPSSTLCPVVPATSIVTTALEEKVLSLVQLLLAAGADARQHGRAGLEAAAAHGYESVVRVLLRAGADPMAHQSAALVAASIQGHDGVVGLLLESGADPWDMSGLALRTAGERGHAPVVEKLRAAFMSTDNNACNNAFAVAHVTPSTSGSAVATRAMARTCSSSQNWSTSNDTTATTRAAQRSGSNLNATAAALAVAMYSTGGDPRGAGCGAAVSRASRDRNVVGSFRLGQGLMMGGALEEAFMSLS